MGSIKKGRTEIYFRQFTVIHHLFDHSDMVKGGFSVQYVIRKEHDLFRENQGVFLLIFFTLLCFHQNYSCFESLEKSFSLRRFPRGCTIAIFRCCKMLFGFSVSLGIVYGDSRYKS